MNSNHSPLRPAQSLQHGDGFDVLDACHRQTLFALGKFAALVTRLRKNGADSGSRALASEVLNHFSNTARQHHEDEELHVFPRLLNSKDPELVQAVLTLKQDHGWLEENWRELAPQLQAVASGYCWFDIDVLHEGMQVFTALSQAHIAMEEAYIYPQARARLRDGEQWKMGREMAARRRTQRAMAAGSK